MTECLHSPANHFQWKKNISNDISIVVRTQPILSQKIQSSNMLTGNKVHLEGQREWFKPLDIQSNCFSHIHFNEI